MLESFFDMAFAVILNVDAFFLDGLFPDFFSGYGNILNSLLTIILAFVMIAYLLYGTKMIVMNYKDIDKKKVKDQLEPFIGGSNHRTFHAAMMNIYFLYRRLTIVVVLIFLIENPGI